MEGTLGAADRISFREGMRGAALRRISRERGLSGELVEVSLGGSSRRRFSIPVPERVCDRRCLSRSGWGKAFIAITIAQAAVVGAERAGIWSETQSQALARDLSAG